MFNSYVKLPEGIESGVRPLCESRVCKNVRSRAIWALENTEATDATVRWFRWFLEEHLLQCDDNIYI